MNRALHGEGGDRHLAQETRSRAERQMPTATIRRVEEGEHRELAGVLARAFGSDPMATYLFPDPARRRPGVERLFRLFMCGVYLPHRECYTGEGLRGGALWLPPGKYPASVWQQLKLLPGFLRLFGLRTPAVFRDIGQMEKMHPIDKPHWYLAFMGVEPSEQGKGWGTAFLRPVLERCDAEGVPAWLETSNEQNVAFYERHGFSVVAGAEIPGGPYHWGMWREPQGQERRSP